MNEQTQIEIEAAAFRHLISHLQEKTDVQNIDLMNLAGFCRNCLSKWYMAAAKEKGRIWIRKDRLLKEIKNRVIEARPDNSTVS